MTLKNREKEIQFVLIFTLVLNIMSALVKIWAGRKFQYFSLASSGLESVFDGFGNVVSLMAIKFASMPSDKNHHYGHQKFENLGSLVISFLLFSSAVSLIIEYKNNLLTGERLVPEFGIVPILSIVFSMSLSFFVSYYEKGKGRALNSKLLLADGEHTFGDLLLSFGVLISIICSKFNWLIPDLVVGIIIILYLIYLAIKIARSNLDDLLDHSPTVKDEYLKEISDIKNIRDIHKFRARGNSHMMHVDFHLLLNPELSLVEAHEVSHQAEDLLKKRLKSYCQNVDVTIHIEPYTKNHMD